MSDAERPSPKTNDILLTQILRVTDLMRTPITEFDLAVTEAALAQAAKHLNAAAVRKFKFVGQISSEGEVGLTLKGTLGATVTLTCVISLKQFNQRIDQDVRRIFVEPNEDDPQSGEIELSENFNEEIEPLGTHIDLGEIALEELALCLPAFPRAPDAVLDQTQFSEPGVVPLSDETSKPFAALAALKAKTQDGA